MGKGGSKLKPKNRSQSIVWGLRGSLSSLPGSRRSKAASAARPHIETRRWLSVLDLDQYSEAFQKFDGVEDLIHLTEGDIKELGVRNSSHRARLVSSLVALKAKYEQGTRKSNKAHRHSVAVDTRRLVVDDHADILVTSNVSQSKSLCNITMDSQHDEPTALRRLLEWELSLDSQDVRAHAWYHGAITRQRAEDIVESDGQFLVRDCTSQPGNYVLSCRHKGAALHFVINKVVLQPATVYERVQFQFEADAYDTVPDLVTYYVGSGKPISAASGARILSPCNRMYPLSLYADRQAPSMAGVSSGMYSSCPRGGDVIPDADMGADMGGPPRLPCKQRNASALAPGRLTLSLAERARPGDSTNKFSTQSLPRTKLTSGALSTTGTVPRHAKMLRVHSDLEAVAGLASPAASSSPPPKPSRVPAARAPAAPGADDHDLDGDVADLGDMTPVSESGSSLASAAALHRLGLGAEQAYHASGSDSGNGSGDSAHSSAAGDVPDSAAAGAGSTPKRGVVLPSSCSSTTLKACDGLIVGLADLAEHPVPALASVLDPDGFQTLLLPSLENKPLDSTALQGIKAMLLDSGSRMLANHLTRADLDLTLASSAPGGQPWDRGLGLGVKSGIELCTLPIGQQLRVDLVERTECLKLLVAVTILTCPTEGERAELLSKWIQVAVDTKTALGNLFGFCAIMLGLCAPQLQRLAATWHVLRQRYTDSAFTFEAKLRPTLKSMNECANPHAPNTTIPHLLPFVLLSSRPNVISGPSSYGLPLATLNACLGPWESSATDLGLGTLWAHLEGARRFCDSLPTFRRNAEIVLGDSKVDELLLDAFRTEFHLKFLWGSRGAAVHAEDRHAKFDQVLTVMSEKCEPPPPAHAHAHAPAHHAHAHSTHAHQSIGTSV